MALGRYRCIWVLGPLRQGPDMLHTVGQPARPARHKLGAASLTRPHLGSRYFSVPIGYLIKAFAFRTTNVERQKGSVLEDSKL